MTKVILGLFYIFFSSFSGAYISGKTPTMAEARKMCKDLPVLKNSPLKHNCRVYLRRAKKAETDDERNQALTQLQKSFEYHNIPRDITMEETNDMMKDGYRGPTPMDPANRAIRGEDLSKPSYHPSNVRIRQAGAAQ